MKRLGQRTRFQRRAKRGFLSHGWIDVILEPLERRITMSVATTTIVDSIYPLLPIDQTHLPRNIDGGKDASDGLTGFQTRINQDHKKRFTEEIASFTDDREGDASDFKATIDWGDVTTEGTIVANSKGGFDVVGSHSYSFGWHGATITITDARAGNESRSSVVESLIYVIPPPLAARGTTIQATAGHGFEGKVATFTGIDTQELDRYVVNVNWGDGHWSSARLKVVEDGVVQVIGKHDFLRPGKFDLRVTITEQQTAPPFYIASTKRDQQREGMLTTADLRIGYWYGSSEQEARTRANVAKGELDGDIAKIDATTGVPFHGVIAHFTPVSGDAQRSAFRALIETPDASNSIEGTIRATDTGFDVLTNHTFLIGGQVSVRILDATGAQVGFATSSIEPKRHLSASVRSFTVKTGEEFRGRVGSFTSIGGENWNSEWSVRIQWGDGSESDGEIVALGDGKFDVVGRHTYSAENYQRERHISITVSEKRTPKSAGMGTPKSVYSVSASSSYDHLITVGVSSKDVFALEGPGYREAILLGSEDSTEIARLTAADASAAFTATVEWDNGTTTTAEVGANGDATFWIAARPANIDKPGAYHGTLSVTSEGVTRSMDVSVYVRGETIVAPPQQPLASIAIERIEATKGVEYIGIIGRFTLLDPESADLGNLTATINWGDGQSSQGTIELVGDGEYVIRGSHTYESAMDTPGQYGSTSIVISDGKREAYAYDADNVRVRIDPNLINADGEHKDARQLEEFEAILAKFTSPVNGATADQFTVTIDWGDGTITSGEVTEGYKHKFEISGKHEYRTDGFFRPKITITGPGGMMATHASVFVQRHPVEVSAADPSVAGFSVSGVMATFIDGDGESSDPDRYRVYHAALIDWGDGTITAGEIVANDRGGFDVVGSHTYATAGDYAVKVIVRRNERHLPSSEPPYFYDGRMYLAADASIKADQGQEFESPTMILRIGAAPGQAPAPQLPDAPLPPATRLSSSKSEAGSPALFAMSAQSEDSLMARTSDAQEDFGEIDDDALLGLQA